MFEKIQHIGYLVADLDAAIDWFKQTFGGDNAGGSNLNPGGVAVPSGGRNAFIHFGQVEVELIEPNDKTNVPDNALVMHHVAYVVADMEKAKPELEAKGFKFASPQANTNVIGQQVLYFDPATTNGFLMHLTQQPAEPSAIGVGQGCQVDHILHAGYLCADVEEAGDGGTIGRGVLGCGAVLLGGVARRHVTRHIAPHVTRHIGPRCSPPVAAISGVYLAGRPSKRSRVSATVRSCAKQ